MSAMRPPSWRPLRSIEDRIMNHSKFLAVALALVMIVPVTALSLSNESYALRETQFDRNYNVFVNVPFNIQLVTIYDDYLDSLDSTNMPDGVSLEVSPVDSVWDGIFIKGSIGAVGTYNFSVVYTCGPPVSTESTCNITLQVSDVPSGVDYNNLGIDAQIDDYLNPFRFGGTEQTLTTTHDKTIRLKPGYYGFKFKGWLWGEEHNSDLTGDTNGLVKDGDGNWVGTLEPGDYDFTGIIDKDNLTFTFHIHVDTKWVNVNYGGEGVEETKQVAYGDPFSLPDYSNGNYTLEGWYDSNGARVGVPGDTYVIYDDMTLNAKWISSVIVMDSDGTVLNVMEVEKDTTCTLPTVTKEGYEFSHWSTEPDGDAVISDGTSPYKPTGDIVLYPVFTDDLRFPIPKFSLVTEG